MSWAYLPLGTSVVSGLPPFMNAFTISTANSTVTIAKTMVPKMRTKREWRRGIYSPREAGRAPPRGVRAVTGEEPVAAGMRRCGTSSKCRPRCDGRANRAR